MTTKKEEGRLCSGDQVEKIKSDNKATKLKRVEKEAENKGDDAQRR